MAAKLEQTQQEIALLREEIRINNARMKKIAAHNRPFYPATERLAILELKNVRGWNLEQTARTFLVEPDTIASWLSRVDEQGNRTIMQVSTPINKLPDFVAYTVQRLKTLCPTMGKRRIADTLTRAGLHLAATSVGRISKQLPAKPPHPTTPTEKSDKAKVNVVTAREPNHVCHMDLTVVPTLFGFAISWFPFSLPTIWPFAWHIAFIVDHFSRKCLGFRIFKTQPTSEQIRSFLAATIRNVGKAPKHLITDQGSQFTAKGYKRWCKRRKIKPRYGAIGHYGSIAIIERFIRSFKEEHIDRILVPFRLQDFRREISAYIDWYNRFRPHQSLAGKTPQEVYSGSTTSPPDLLTEKAETTNLDLTVLWHRDQKHLPIVELRKVA